MFRFLPLLITVAIGCSTPALCFTLLSGPNKAKLPVSVSNPEIVFKWNGSAPKIKEKEEYRGGQYTDLEDNDFMLILLQDSFGRWNDVKASFLKMTIEEDTTAKLDGEDEIFSIVVEKSKNAAAAAFALPLLSDSGSTIKDCDISISDSETTAKNLAYTLTHEIGHCIGLGHSHSNYNAIMGYSRGAGTTKLGGDDIAGLLYLYLHPDYKDEELEFLGCATLPKKTGNASLVFLLLAPLMGALVRKRRQPC